MRVHLLFFFVLVLLCCTTARRNGGGRRGGRNGGGRRGGGRGGGGRGGGGRGGGGRGGGGGGGGDGGTCGGQLDALRAAFPEGLWIDSETCLDFFFTIVFMQNHWIFFGMMDSMRVLKDGNHFTWGLRKKLFGQII